MFGKKTASGREKKFSCVDECLAGSVGLGGQGMATDHSYLLVYVITKAQSLLCILRIIELFEVMISSVSHRSKL